MNAVSRERDLERAQRRRLEVEVGKKDKHIEDLLSSGHITVRGEGCEGEGCEGEWEECEGSVNVGAMGRNMGGCYKL